MGKRVAALILAGLLTAGGFTASTALDAEAGNSLGNSLKAKAVIAQGNSL
jgi:hypothetical protein